MTDAVSSRAAAWVCARCHQRLAHPPTVVQGVGYGPKCAVVMGGFVGDLLTQRDERKRPAARIFSSRRRSRRTDPQFDLFSENQPAEPAQSALIA